MGKQTLGRTGRRGLGWLRQQVLDRDGSVCQYCGGPATDVDHVYPHFQGGPDILTNLVVCCRQCNSTVGMRTFVNFAAKRAYVRGQRSLDAGLKTPRFIDIETVIDNPVPNPYDTPEQWA